ncbi:MAG: DUF2207 domain-containing protein [Lachnospiraceae bacterium]|jgi:hypothetical protein|nr:DUF2207 domain-containing protein [Lachnospiraceae bacterium]
MTAVFVIANIIFLLGYIIYNSHDTLKYGKLILNKKRRWFNITIAIIFIVYVITQTIYIYSIQPETVSIEQLRQDSDSVKTSGDRLFGAVMWLMLSPIVWITLYRLYKEITEAYFSRRYIKSKKTSNYYRGTLENTSPAIVSFLLENNINVGKSITAILLKLKLEGYIEEKNKKLVCTKLNINNLSKIEQNVINTIKTNTFSSETYIEEVEREALKLKLLSKYTSKLKKTYKIFVSTLPRIAIFAIIITMTIAFTKLDSYLKEDSYIFTNDNFDTVGVDDYYKKRYLKVTKDVYDKYKEERVKEITKLVEEEYSKKEKATPEEAVTPTPSTSSSSWEMREMTQIEITPEIEKSLMRFKYNLQDIKDKVFFESGNNNYYIEAKRINVGLVSLDLLMNIVETTLSALLFLAIVSVISIIRYIIVSAKYSNKYVLTNKGMKLRKEILGLKKFLKDYSLIKTRTKEEVVIWEYYLIYAVVLHENFKIEDKVIKQFVKEL